MRNPVFCRLHRFGVGGRSTGEFRKVPTGCLQTGHSATPETSPRPRATWSRRRPRCPRRAQSFRTAGKNKDSLLKPLISNSRQVPIEHSFQRRNLLPGSGVRPLNSCLPLKGSRSTFLLWTGGSFLHRHLLSDLLGDSFVRIKNSPCLRSVSSFPTALFHSKVHSRWP